MVVRFVDECKYTDCFCENESCRGIFSAHKAFRRVKGGSRIRLGALLSVSSVARTAYYVQPGHIHTSLQRLGDSWAG